MKIFIPRLRTCRSLLLAAVFTVASLTALAKDAAHYFLPPGSPEAATLLAPPPLPDSPEQTADLATVRNVFHSATSSEVAAANAERYFSVYNFSGVIGEFFNPTNLPKTTVFFKKVHADARTVTALGKDYFHRPRPFMVDTNLATGELEKNFSYPSGHSTENMVFALVLAELFPEKRDALLAHARLMGWHRVQIARHYPTDVVAGRVLAQAIVREFKQNQNFEKELAAARAEIEAVRSTAKN